VAVLGSGIMGAGIAQLAAMSGYEVTLYDINNEILNKALQKIKEGLDRMEAKGLLKIPAGEVFGKIRCYTELEEAASGADLVIEAVPEILDLKIGIFEKLDNICPEHTILASNTSGISITAIGSKVRRRDKIIGAHFFNPAVKMRLVEIICAMETSPETLKIVEEFSHSLGKETVVCRKDRQGFITTRMLAAQRAEAYRILEEGIATKEDIDKAMRFAFNHPMGPFELADMAGLDTGLKVLRSLFETYGEHYHPPQFLEQLVAVNYLGRKTGKGFYSY